jgi:hypothetical protein
MDDGTSRAAERLDRAAERVKVGLTAAMAFLVALAAWATFLYFLLARISNGTSGAD